MKNFFKWVAQVVALLLVAVVLSQCQTDQGSSAGPAGKTLAAAPPSATVVINGFAIQPGSGWVPGNKGETWATVRNGGVFLTFWSVTPNPLYKIDSFMEKSVDVRLNKYDEGYGHTISSKTEGTTTLASGERVAWVQYTIIINGHMRDISFFWVAKKDAKGNDIQWIRGNLWSNDDFYSVSAEMTKQVASGIRIDRVSPPTALR